MKGPARKATLARLGTAHEAPKTQVAPALLTGALTLEQAAALPLPRWLPRTKMFKETWCIITTDCATRGLRDSDVPSLEMLLVAKARHYQAGSFIKKYGVMVRGAYGPTKNPMLREERDQALLADRLLQRLGLSPEARVRLNLIQVAGMSMLGTLRQKLDAAVERDMAETEFVDGMYVVEDG